MAHEITRALEVLECAKEHVDGLAISAYNDQKRALASYAWGYCQLALDLVLRKELMLKLDGGPKAKACLKEPRRQVAAAASAAKKQFMYLAFGKSVCDYGEQPNLRANIGVAHRLLKEAIDGHD
jgi:hypothetical protein